MSLKLNYLHTRTDDKLGAKQTQHLVVKWMGGECHGGRSFAASWVHVWTFLNKELNTVFNWVYSLFSHKCKRLLRRKPKEPLMSGKASASTKYATGNTWGLTINFQMTSYVLDRPCFWYDPSVFLQQNKVHKEISSIVFTFRCGKNGIQALKEKLILGRICEGLSQWRFRNPGVIIQVRHCFICPQMMCNDSDWDWIRILTQESQK